MPVTGLRGRQILDGDVVRADLNTTTAGSAVITRIIAGTNISITSTGVDAGTGDVTINATGGGSSLNGTGFVRMNGTEVSYITGTAAQFVKANGTLDSSVYLTSYTETDTLATVTGRGASTSTAVTFNGNISVGSAASLSFGSQTRQMISLWSTLYGIGVQSSTLYFRTDSRFSWHRGGSHNDAENNPGGGTVAMTLDASSNLAVTGTLTASSIIRSGGTASQFLMANGSVSTNPGWITGYTETDTLATVTGRGSSTSTLTTFSGGLILETSYRFNRVYGFGNYSANFSNSVSTTETWFRLGNASPFSQTRIYYRAGSSTSEEEGEIKISNTCVQPFIEWTRNTYNYHIREVRCRMQGSCQPCEVWVLVRHGNGYGGVNTNFQWQIHSGTDSGFSVVNATGTPGTGTNEASINTTDGYFYRSTGNIGIGGTLTANSIVKSGGTSSQFLKADGSVDSSTYITGNQSITLSGDATGSGTTAIAVTLANSGVTAGTYRSVTVDAKGRVTGGSNPTTISGYGITDFFSQTLGAAYVVGANTAITGTDTLEVMLEKLQGQVNARLTGNQSISVSGDATGSGTTSIALTLATVNSNIGTFNNVTVNAKGLVTAASNLSYLRSDIIQQGGKSYVTHDFNSYPALYDVIFVNPSGSSNLPTGMSAVMSYRFIMGAGDTTSRGFDLVGAAEGSGNLYIRERSIGTWNRLWHSGNLTNLNQLTNGPGYVTGGPYLPLSGGTMTGAIIMSGTQQIRVAGFAGIEYYNGTAQWQGYIGTENNTGNLRYNSFNGAHTWYANSTQTMSLNSSGTLSVGRVVTTGLYGPSATGNIPIWQYDASNPGYGIVYFESNPDLLRIDVSGQALSGTPDFLIGPDYAQVNGNTVWHSGNLTNLNQLSNGPGYTSNTGTVTSVSGTGTVSGLTLSGTVTSSGSLTLGGTLTLTSGQVTGALGYTPYNSSNPSGYITSSSLSSYLPLSGGTMSGNVQFNSNLLQFNNSGVRSWNIGISGGNLNIYSGDGSGSLHYNGRPIRDSYYRTFSGFSDYYSGGTGGWYRVAEITLTSNCSGAVIYGTVYDNRYDGADTYQVAVVARADCGFSSDNEAHYINVGCTILGSTNFANYRDKIRVVLSASSSGSRTYELQFYETPWNHDTWQIESNGWTVYASPQAPRAAVGTSRVNYISKQNADNYFANTAVYSPIYYDSANSSYYLDLNSTTSIRTVGSWRSDSGAWDGEFSGKIQYHSNHWYFQSGDLWIFRNAGGSNVFTVNQSGNGTFSGTVSASNITTGVTASHIVQRDGNGYIYANHINFNTSESENPTISSFITSNGDGWSRKSSLQHVRNQLGNYGGWITQTNALQPVYGNSGSFNIDTNAGQHATVRFSQGTWGGTNPNPGNWSHIFSVNGSTDNRTVQLYMGDIPGAIWWRMNQGGTQHPWERILTSNNFTSFAVPIRGQSNWNDSTVLDDVIGLLAWKNYGNGHVIFDASQGTSPSGGGVSQTNATVAWAASYPTLMGWNGSTTYGVRVDSARVADSAGSITGFNNPTTSATANTIAYRDSVGDITVRELVLNVSVQDFTPSSMVAIYPTTNQAVKVTASGARAFLNVPTRTGGDASGTWSINITGSAASASSATNASNAVYLGSHDLRSIAPNSHDAYKLRFGFTSWANNNTAPWADYLHLRSYSDGSGGSDNLVMFLKSGIGMRIWQQSFGSGSTYSSYVDVLHSSNYNSYSPTLTGGGASGTWGISITGASYSSTVATYLGGASDSVDAADISTRRGSGFFQSSAPGSGWPSGASSWWHMLSTTHSNGGNYYAMQLAASFFSQGLWYRSTNGSGATAWDRIPLANGGTYNMSISGNAANTSSISNAVGGGYTWTGPQYFQSNLGSTSGSLNTPPLQVYATGGNSAFFSWHRAGNYAVNMGLDSDNVLRIGGWSAAANRWQLDMSGNMTVAGDVTAYSDARVKENVQTVENALDKTLRLRGVTYTRTDSDDKKTKLGVIAQEIMEVLPEVVNQDNAGMYNVSYGNIVGVLIEAIKEQQQQIEELKAKLDAFTK